MANDGFDGVSRMLAGLGELQADLNRSKMGVTNIPSDTAQKLVDALHSVRMLLANLDGLYATDRKEIPTVIKARLMWKIDTSAMLKVVDEAISKGNQAGIP